MSDHEGEGTGHPRVFRLIVKRPSATIASLTGDVVLDDKGRFRLASLSVLPAPGHLIDTNLWKSVPVAKIETVLNDPRFRDDQLERSKDPNYTIVFEGSLDDWFRNFKQRKASLRLGSLPEGPRYPDSFYRKVAAAYTRLAHEGRGPAQVLADVNDVPETTIVRWIREARRRGFLAPSGGKGRIG
jgi:hypothetical protein